MSRLRDLSVACGATLVATAITPNGMAGVLYPLDWIAPTAYSNVLTEWVSTDFHQPVFMVFEAMLLVLIVGLSLGRPRLNWTQLLLIVAFTYLALSESRNVAVWAVVVSPILAIVLQQLRSGTPTYSRPLLKPGRERALNLTLLLLVCVAFPLEAFHFVNDRTLRAGVIATYPVGAVAYMNRHQLPTRTFNAYAWGGYLLWAGYPRYRDFIDGRANTLFDTRILDEYLNVSSAAPNWQSILNQNHVGNVLIPPGSPLASVLAESRDWRLAYHDTTAVLYTRSRQNS